MDLDDMLIEEVRNRPFLYDLAQKDYKNLKKKDYAWKEIAARTKLGELKCKKRWKSLRDTYKRCKRMKQVSTGNSAETAKKTWKYLEAMSFLDNTKYARRTIRSSSEEVDCIDENDILEIKQEDSANISLSASESSQCRSSHAWGQEVQKKYSDKFQQFLNLAGASISETCAAFVEQTQKQNTTALHFSSLAAKITEAGLPPNVVNQIEAKVSALVFGEIDKFYSGLLK
ncbi:uncharacterized protein [Bactrocera oleae]|uniref:uncharacterized protein isoform X2 n=1 Tax=Bactrocera oleae TaxID=104688 RepID=UPI0006B6E9E5|nr:uncharacterized protein LOC106621857 isoform X2 [Bactrocera oleae]XP_036226635.1 uncharacterized protein LOC118679765 isoform X2 [Bactrocera oleae]